MSTARVIAIDGPAASGKSSTAVAVARALGFAHIDSGSLYRALTWVAVRAGVRDPDVIIALAGRLNVRLVPHADTPRVHIDGVDDVEWAIRETEVNTRVSVIAAIPMLRDWVNVQLRAVAAGGDAVIDGRDIGTVVVPDAGLKIFLTATAEARARRRLLQQGGIEGPAQLAAETARLAERDRLDANRAVAPLRQAADAVVLDTTESSFDEQVERVVALARERGLAG
ncbi:MAG: (d)CMP kinase [Gemmatimonadales bacterium]